MKKCFKLISGIIVFAMALTVIPACDYNIAERASAAGTLCVCESTDNIEEGEQYVLLYTTTSGSESDVSKFYYNNGTLAALSASDSGIKAVTVKDSSVTDDKKTAYIDKDAIDSMLWTIEKSGDGAYILSNGNKYLQDNGSGSMTLADSKSDEGCEWTYAAAVGESKYDYTPLRSKNNGNVIRYSSSASGLILANPDTHYDTDSRNSNVYFYKYTDKTEESLPVPARPEVDKKLLAEIITCSDFQKFNSSWQDDWETLKKQLSDICDGAYNGGLTNPGFFLFGGDYAVDNDAKLSDKGQGFVKDIIGNRWPDIGEDNYLLLQGNHDPGDTAGLVPTGAYEFDEFIVYMLNEDDFPTKQGEDEVYDLVWDTAGRLDSYLKQCALEKETRPVIVASHTGLHYDIDRTDGNNQYAYLIYDVLHDYGDSLDIIYMFGHNHTNGDEQVGGSITFYNKGEKLDVCREDSIANKKGTTSPINFAYMNYGYVGYIGNIHNQPTNFTPTDMLTVTSISIYEDEITIDRFSNNGWEKDYCRTIKRDQAPKPTMTPAPGAASDKDISAPEPAVVPSANNTIPSVTAVTDNGNVPSAGTIVTSKGASYLITGKGEVSFRGLSNKKCKSAAVPDSITADGNKYIVKSIGAKAFAGCKELKKVTIGKNVTSIGAKAFDRCGRLKSIIVRSAKLSKVANNAFKGINAKALIKVRSKSGAVKKLLKNKGQKKTVIIR